MDFIDSLSSFAKGSPHSNHKYLSRKPNRRGGYDYVYPSDVKIRTAKRKKTGGFSAEDRHDVGVTRHYGSIAGAGEVHIDAGLLHAGDPHVRAAMESALHDTHQENSPSVRAPKVDTKKLLEGNLGIKRVDMPQIRSFKLNDFLAKLREKGIGTKEGAHPVSKLRSTQSEIHAEHVQEIISDPKMRPNLDKTVIVSKDGYLLDGHHRWAALSTIDPDSKIKTVSVNLPIKKLLKEAGAYQGVEHQKSEGAMDFIGDLEALAKSDDTDDEMAGYWSPGVARGGKYYRRTPTGNPKRPWRYYYTQAEYEARPDAHASGVEKKQAIKRKRTFVSMKVAMEKYGLPETTKMEQHAKGGGDYPPERKRLHEEILSEFLDKVKGPPPPKPGHAPVALLTVGGPASGKSTLLKHLDENFDDHVMIAADDVKERLPEFKRALNLDTKGGMPVTAQHSGWMAHDESTDIADELERRVMDSGKSAIFDGTGKNLPKMLAKIAELKKRGYHVRVVMPHVPMGEAIQRLHSRSQDSGRTLPVDSAIDMHRKIPANFEKIARAADDFALYKSGFPPTKVWSGGKDREDTIHHPGEMRKFDLARGLSADVDAEKAHADYVAKKSEGSEPLATQIDASEEKPKGPRPPDRTLEETMEIIDRWDGSIHNHDDGRSKVPHDGDIEEGLVDVMDGAEHHTRKHLDRANRVKPKVKKSMDPIDDLESFAKGEGEGARGGHVIGHTSGGHPIYASHKTFDYDWRERRHHVRAVHRAAEGAKQKLDEAMRGAGNSPAGKERVEAAHKEHREAQGALHRAWVTHAEHGSLHHTEIDHLKGRSKHSVTEELQQRHGDRAGDLYEQHKHEIHGKAPSQGAKMPSMHPRGDEERTAGGEGIRVKPAVEPQGDSQARETPRREGIPPMHPRAAEKSMDNIDSLESFAKAAGHKYISRKRNAHGGYDYVYKHPQGYKFKVSTEHTEFPGSHQVTSREPGGPAEHRGIGYDRKDRRETAVEVHEAIDDATHRAAHHEAVALTLREKAKHEERGHITDDPEAEARGFKDLEERDAANRRPKPKYDRKPGEKQVEAGRKKLAPYSETGETGGIMERQQKLYERATSGGAQEGRFYGPGGHEMQPPSMWSEPGGYEKWKAMMPKGYVKERPAKKSDSAQRAEERIMGDEMQKGLYTFMGQGPDTAIPEAFLYDYLCAFIEEAYEHERCEHVHENVLVPPASTGEKIEDMYAQAILHELVSMIPRNANLKRAATKFSVTRETIAVILRDKGLVRPYSDAGTWTNDYDSMRSMGGEGVTRPLMLSENGGKSYRDIVADPFAAPGVVLAKGGAADASALYVDDSQDPHVALAKAETGRLIAAQIRQTSEWLPNISSTCLIHGSGDLTKSMSLEHTHARCSCPR
jgi:predicted kinase